MVSPFTYFLIRSPEPCRHIFYLLHGSKPDSLYSIKHTHDDLWSKIIIHLTQEMVKCACLCTSRVEHQTAAKMVNLIICGQIILSPARGTVPVTSHAASGQQYLPVFGYH